eukprot:2366577-Amphidinium_carterae.1
MADEVFLTVPLSRLLDWAFHVKKEIHYIELAPPVVSRPVSLYRELYGHDQGVQTEVSEVQVAEETVALTSDLHSEFAELCVGTSCSSIVADSDRGGPEPCIGLGCSSIAADSVKEYGKSSAESGFQPTSEKTSQGQAVVAEGTTRSRKPRKRARSSGWVELVLLAFATQLVCDYLEVP